MPAKNGSAAHFLGPARTGNYRPSVHSHIPHWWLNGQRGFSRSDVELMRRDPRINFGLSIIAAPLFRVTWQVVGPHEDVNQFVDRQLKRFWQRDLIHVIKLTAWGFCPAEVLYRPNQQSDLIEYDRLRDLYPLDCRPREMGGRLTGFRVAGATGTMLSTAEPIRTPRMFWAVNEPEYGGHYGRSRLEGAWEPWMEKVGKKGANDVRRLWHIKNAFHGGIIRHPAGPIELGNGQTMANEDYAREVLEKLMTGGVLVLPNSRDEEGNLLWTYEPPAPNGEPPSILEYPKALSEEELEGLNIPPEVVKASEAGSGWSGRSVPFLVFLTGEDQVAFQILDPFDRYVCRPLVWVNFGSDKDYQIVPASLTELAKQQGQDDEGTDPRAGPGGGGQPPGGGRGPNGQVPYQGPRGGQGYRDPATGRVHYGLSLGGPEVIQPLDITDAIKTAVREALAERQPILLGNWTRYDGPQGGRGWKNSQTGEVLYQEQEPGAGSDPSPTAGDSQTATPERKAVLKQVLAGAMSSYQAAKETAGRMGQAAWDKLPAKVQDKLAATYRMAKAVEHHAMTAFRKGKELALEAARERGLSEEHVEKVGRILGIADMTTAWTINAPVVGALTGSVAAAKVASFLPVASLAYIAGSTVRNPFATIRAAKKVLRSGKPVHLSLDAAGEAEMAGRLLEAFQKPADTDWYTALISAALDDGNDLGSALDRADTAIQQHPDAAEPVELSRGPWVSAELLERVREVAEHRYPRRIRLSMDEETHGDYQALAEFYADHWNLLAAAGMPVPEEELLRVDEELAQSDWVLKHDAASGRWSVVHGGILELSLPSIRLAVNRAPKGGVSIGAKHFRGGQFIPSAELAKATPEERAKVEAAGDPTRDRLRSRGSVDKETLRGHLAEHAGDLDKGQHTAARRSYQALKAHYGELAPHRIEELAHDTRAALAQLGDNPEMEGVRNQLSGRLKAFGHMLNWSEADGLHGQVAESDQTAAAGRHGERQRVQAEQKQAAASRSSLPKSPVPGQVYNAKTEELQVDPERFQVKLNTEKGTGVTQELKQVTHWNPDFAGVISAWKDPVDGKTYVVNGHHRRELAGRLGVDNMAIRYIDAKDATEARAKGALINIAEGRGTAVDAAKFMRDTGVTVDDLGKHGVSLKGKLAANASTMTALSDRLFNKLAMGTLEEDRALAIAEHLKDHDLQNQLFGIVERREDESGKGLTPRIVAEMAREMALTPTASAGEGGLFGDLDDTKESLIVERGELKDDLRRDLAGNAAAYAAVSSERRAAKVADAGNVLNVEENQKRAAEAERVKNTFDAMLKYKGPVNDAINEAAGEFRNAKGKRERDGIKDKLRERVRGILADEADGGTEKPAADGRGEGSGTEPATPIGAETAADAGGGSVEPVGVGDPSAPEHHREHWRNIPLTDASKQEAANRFAELETEREALNREGDLQARGLVRTTDSTAKAEKQRRLDAVNARLREIDDQQGHMKEWRDGRLPSAEQVKQDWYDHRYEDNPKEAVRNALEKGVRIPPEVLADHPDLTAAKQAASDDFSASLQSIPVGELHTVAGFKVRRTADNEFRIETQTGTGNVHGDAAKVLEHIQRQQTSDKMYGRLRTEALARAESHREPNFLEADRMEAATKAFQALPHWTPVVSLEEDTHGRTGRIVKDEDGRTRVKLDGEDGYASNFVEPLEAKHSWRVPEGQKVKPAEPVEQPDLFASSPATDTAPEAVAADYPQTDRAERDALARQHGVHDVPRADVDALVAAVQKHGGGSNMANLAHVRRELGWDKPRADRAIQRARIERAISLSAAEGRHGITAEEQAAALPGDVPGQVLLHAGIRPEWGGPAKPAAPLPPGVVRRPPPRSTGEIEAVKKLAALVKNPDRDANAEAAARAEVYGHVRQRLAKDIRDAVAKPPHASQETAVQAFASLKPGEYVTDSKGRIGHIRQSTKPGTVAEMENGVVWLDTDDTETLSVLKQDDGILDIRPLGLSETAKKQ